MDRAAWGLFNSRPSARGDHILSNVSHHVLHFNSRPSVRGDPQVLGGGCVLCISIHAPPRGATTIRCSTCRGTNFNSRPSARGDSSRNCSIHAGSYFNSRPSARGDGVTITCERRYPIISIHAPPRGATIRYCELLCGLTCISIHAPPRGATDTRVGIPTCNTISIHAPPRGAT